MATTLRHQQFVGVTLDMFDVGSFMGRIEGIMDQIEAVHFHKTISWKCKWCDVDQLCTQIDQQAV